MVDIKRIKENDYELISVIGEVDASSSIELDNAIIEAVNSGGKRFLIDCTSLEYISSAGLGVFMAHIEDFNEKGINVVLFGLNDKVANVFEILGLDQLLQLADSKDEAKSQLER